MNATIVDRFGFLTIKLLRQERNDFIITYLQSNLQIIFVRCKISKYHLEESILDSLCVRS